MGGRTKRKTKLVIGTGDKKDPGVIRFDFPGYSGEGGLKEISWDEWFQQFEENGLGLLVQDELASGEKSNFNKLVSRNDAKAKDQAKNKQSNAGTTSKAPSGRDSNSKSSSRKKTSSTAYR